MNLVLAPSLLFAWVFNDGSESVLFSLRRKVSTMKVVSYHQTGEEIQLTLTVVCSHCAD